MTEDRDYWFSATECFSCDGDLKIETRKDRKVLVCKKCGAVNASVPKVTE